MSDRPVPPRRFPHRGQLVFGVIDVEEFARRKGCTPTEGKEYRAAQQAARSVKLADFVTRSVWEIAKEEGGYVRDVLETRYRAVHAKTRDLRENELAAIGQVAEEPPLEPLDLTGSKPENASVPPSFEAMERAFGMDPKNRRVEQITPSLPD